MSSTARQSLRQLGRDGPYIPAIGFGMMGMSLGYGPAATEEERMQLLNKAWELGCTNWDTADIYGDNEDFIGNWFRKYPARHQDIFLASKFGLKPSEDGNVTIDSSPEYCKECLERSLQRLGVDQIDLYYIHRASPEIPIETTMDAMRELFIQGKIRYIGLSEVSASTLRRTHNVHPISAVQVECSPGHLLATCRELGVSTFAYAPLGRGIMTGMYRSSADFGPGNARAIMERLQGNSFEKKLKLVDGFIKLAMQKGCTSGQGSLRTFYPIPIVEHSPHDIRCGGRAWKVFLNPNETPGALHIHHGTARDSEYKLHTKNNDP
ncbi:NADP-dependent oxidoreductase domain-containing protein [Xylaria digitata]|nr:NADP-dependent oxidoreductase domain-containing protein [Xylaria digitata]